MGFTAALYDAVLWRGERRGMKDRRASILADARGRTLEIGAGTGLNLPYYPEHLDELVLTEPVKAMAVRLEKRAQGRANTRVVSAGAESLPFDDDSFDTVISTMVFCTVDNPEQAAAEVSRVLKPDGQLLFIEHVRSSEEGLARWQDRLAKPWHAWADGCNCNRPLVDMISGSVRVESIEVASWTGMPSIVKPLVIGRARIGA
jgi:ubiquinone/menaquinone biosynthesis C-methylase UbiE